jgi:hypothetical protein
MHRYGFQNDKLKVLTGDGRNCDLLDYLEFVDKYGNRFRTKTSTDGISTPRFIWSLIAPFGKLWKSGVLHDGAFRDNLEYLDWHKQKWMPITLDEDACNELIFDAMRSQRATRLERYAIYINLQWFGWRAFDEDRRKKSNATRGIYKMRYQQA